MGKEIKIIIADDNRNFCQMLQNYLQGQEDLVIVGVANNGLEAMEDKGVITLNTWLEEKAVNLSIKDQGKGIPEDILEKIWQPFFTSKETGTGLGLPICFNIATRNNAKIDVKSHETGTIFTIKFSIDEQQEL